VVSFVSSSIIGYKCCTNSTNSTNMMTEIEDQKRLYDMIDRNSFGFEKFVNT